MDFSSLSSLYRDELLNCVVPFWLHNSQDTQYGGYFHCLDRDGTVYETDKYMWLQGRQIWMFATLYDKVERRQDWLECARQGAEFIKEFGHDGDHNWYFSLTRDGRPLIQPYNIFSYTFAAMAFARLAAATGSDEYADIAKKTYDRILQRASNPKGEWCKAFPGTRPTKGFSLPMILCNLALEMEPLLRPDDFNGIIENCLHEVLSVFYREEDGIIVENVNMDGTLSDTFDGRLVNPGHALEAMWFVMDLGVRLARQDIIKKAVRIALQMAEYGWDNEYGGIFYYMDRLGRPMQQLEWDQKLWWVHIEAMIAMIKGYSLTGSRECLEWFDKLHDYTWSRFKDKEYPEWFGYLNRRGEVLLPLKGGKWKGCFHVPRGLYECWKTLEKCSRTENRDGTFRRENSSRVPSI
ncbi:MAG: AGE family epimerase/isomerase [Alistipes sp.]|nr:AGE family epimerase/isomerase [Alistipes sp.]